MHNQVDALLSRPLALVVALALVSLLPFVFMTLTSFVKISTVLGSLQPQNAGAAAGALSTMQQVGNALGVAVTGVIFFGALDGGFGHAFEVSLIQLALLGAAVTALTWLLPRHEAASA